MSRPQRLPPVAQGRIAYLDGLRGAAALFVVLHHAYLTVWPPERPPSGALGSALSWLGYGRYAVVFFLVLSGYCLMLPVLKSDEGRPRAGWGAFFARRFRRIVPTYWLAMLLTLTLISAPLGVETGGHWDMCIPVSFEGIAWHALLLQDLFMPRVGGQINHVYWSIAIEWHLYFLFPLLLFLRRRVGMARTALLAGTVAVALAWALRKSLLSGLTLHFAALFVAGMLVAEVAKAPPKLPWRALAAAALLFLVGISVAMAGRERTQIYYLVTDLSAGVFASALLLCAASESEGAGLRRLFGLRVPLFLGVMGYSLYLMHAPLLQLTWQYALRPLNLAPLTTFGLLVALLPAIAGACYLFFLACERPFFRKD